MFILTRRQSQVIVVGDDIQIAIVGIDGEEVRMGFIAPQDVVIRREEAPESIQHDNEDAHLTGTGGRN